MQRKWRRRQGLLGARAGRWAVALLALTLASGSLAETHPGSVLHADLPAADWIFLEACHAGDAPHAEAAGAPHRSECRACLHRLQAGGAAWRALAVQRLSPLIDELSGAPASRPLRHQPLARSSRAPPLS